MDKNELKPATKILRIAVQGWCGTYYKRKTILDEFYHEMRKPNR
jgi:hypothetical protein